MTSSSYQSLAAAIALIDYTHHALAEYSIELLQPSTGAASELSTEERLQVLTDVSIRKLGGRLKVRAGAEGPRTGAARAVCQARVGGRAPHRAHCCPGRPPIRARQEPELGLRVVLSASTPRFLGRPSRRGQPRTCSGQAQVLLNRAHPSCSLHVRQHPQACLHTSRRRTRRRRTSSSATRRKFTRGVLCFIRSILAAASFPRSRLLLTCLGEQAHRSNVRPGSPLRGSPAIFFHGRVRRRGPGCTRIHG